MALLVQNDAGTQAGANSYVTVPEFQEYWTARGVDYTTKTDEEIEAYLIPALSYLDTRFVWAAYKLNGRDQTTEFPREDLYDCSGSTPVLVAGVPREIKEAQNEYGKIFADQGTLQPNGNINGDVKRSREKVDTLEAEYEYSPAGQSGGIIPYPAADNKIPKCFISPSYYGGLATHT